MIIGGGHNGLVTAFYLAKAGYKPLVLERRAQPGGAAITEEFHPGFRCSTLAHSAGPLRPDIVRDMQLEKHGLNMISTEVAVTSLSPDGRALILYKDTEKAAQEIAKFSAEGCDQVSPVPGVAGQDGQSNRQGAHSGPAGHRQSQFGRSLGHAQHRPRRTQTGQARYVPPAALGTDGRRRSGGGIFRDRTAPRHHRRARNFRNISRPVVRRQQSRSSDPRRGRRAAPPALRGSPPAAWAP